MCHWSTGNFPKPVSIEELGARLLQQERIDKFGEDALVKEDSGEFLLFFQEFSFTLALHFIIKTL